MLTSLQMHIHHMFPHTNTLFHLQRWAQQRRPRPSSTPTETQTTEAHHVWSRLCGRLWGMPVTWRVNNGSKYRTLRMGRHTLLYYNISIFDWSKWQLTHYGVGHFFCETCCSFLMGNLQRGDTETQNGYTFCMLLGQVALTGTVQAQLCYVIFSAAELETGK